MLKFLCEAGGVSYDEAAGVGEERRYATLGALALLTGGMAALSSGATAYSQLHLPWFVIAPVAAFIGLAVYCLDRMFVLVPLGRDTAGYRLQMLATRGLVSVVLGLFISHGLVMYAFNTDLTSRVETAAAQAADAAEENVRASSTTEADNRSLVKESDRLQAEINRVQKSADTKKKEWRDNTACLNGTVFAADGDYCGAGGVSPGLKSDWLTAKETATTTKIENEAAIAINRATIAENRKRLQKKIDTARDAASSQTGVAAKTRALLKLLSEDPFLLILPLLFLVLDLAVVLAKAMLPASELDRRSMRQKALHDSVMTDIASEPAMLDAKRRLAELEAKRLVRTAVNQEARAEARDRRATERYLKRHDRPRAGRGRLVTWAIGATGVAVVAATGLATVLVSGDAPTPQPAAATPTAEPSGDGEALVAEASDSDRVLDLGHGVTLELPHGAIRGNAKVVATPSVAGTMKGRLGHAAISPAFEITTPTAVVGRGRTAPRLVMEVPDNLLDQADTGSLSVAFRAAKGWEQVEGTYDPTDHTFTVEMPHFSWWQFWTWDWAAIGAGISQHTLSVIGMRSMDTPQCTNGVPLPDWFKEARGIASENGFVIRACAQGSKEHPGVLDVQIVNNRPIGMILNYNGANVQWGWHQPPTSIAQAISYAAGDAAAQAADGLFIPPLGRASIGIFSPGLGQNHPYFIGQTYATLGSDIIELLGESGLSSAAGKTVTMPVFNAYRDAFKASMSGACAAMLTPVVTSSPEAGGTKLLEAILKGSFAECLSRVTLVATRSALSQGVDLPALVRMSDTITGLRNLARAGTLFNVAQGIGKVGDLWVDSWAAATDEGYGFKVYAKSSQPTPEPTPTSPSPSPTPTSPLPNPAPTSPSPNPTPSSPSPSPTQNMSPSPTQGPTQNPSPIPTQTPTPTPPQPTSSGQPIKVYDNYGTVTTAGTPMCAGNPGRPESMPGGSLTQSFTSGAAATLTSARIQIDPNAALTVTAVVNVNGVDMTSTMAVPAADTDFTFSPVNVNAGDAVGIKLTWSGSPIPGLNPKLDTIYTVGVPGGTLSVINTCPDGAPTYTTTGTGLRAIISGITR